MPVPDLASCERKVPTSGIHRFLVRTRIDQPNVGYDGSVPEEAHAVNAVRGLVPTSVHRSLTYAAVFPVKSGIPFIPTEKSESVIG